MSLNEINNLAIVLRGNFNPTIFQPEWFKRENLVPSEELMEGNLKISILHPEITDFSTDWFQLRVTKDKFVIITKNKARFEPLRDLVQGTFEMLSHTPLRQMGINRDFVFIGENDSQMDNLDIFYSKNIWEKIVGKPRLISQIILEPKTFNDTDLKGYIRVELKPEEKNENQMVIHINDHFEISDKFDGADKFSEILNLQWIEIERKAYDIAEKIRKVINDQ